MSDMTLLEFLIKWSSALARHRIAWIFFYKYLGTVKMNGQRDALCCGAGDTHHSEFPWYPATEGSVPHVDASIFHPAGCWRFVWLLFVCLYWCWTCLVYPLGFQGSSWDGSLLEETIVLPVMNMSSCWLFICVCRASLSIPILSYM